MLKALIASMGPFGPLLPEIVLAVGAMAILMYGAFRGEKSGEMSNWYAILLMVIAAMLVLREGGERVVTFEGAFVVDGFARIMKLLSLAGAAVVLYMSAGYMRDAKLMKFEFPVLALLATVGMMMMISANDLITLYLGLELQSLSLYVIAAFRRDSVRSSEAGLKYFVLGALSSGMLLYGSSLIYGFTGTTTFSGIAFALKDGGSSLGLIFGLVFFMAGLAFKISAVPFHMWTPDVYEGAPTPVTAFFAAAPKVAAMALFVRAMMSPFPAI
ncbi:MAG: NADH-quinone oxidoreductase subunit N, partial [Hyphomicrobiales bacterium]